METKVIKHQETGDELLLAKENLYIKKKKLRVARLKEDMLKDLPAENFSADPTIIGDFEFADTDN